MKKAFFTLILLICCVQNSPADIIELRSGRVVEGEITLETESYVRILTNEQIRMQEFLTHEILNIKKGEWLPKDVAPEPEPEPEPEVQPEPVVEDSVAVEEAPAQEVIPESPVENVEEVVVEAVSDEEAIVEEVEAVEVVPEEIVPVEAEPVVENFEAKIEESTELVEKSVPEVVDVIPEAISQDVIPEPVSEPEIVEPIQQPVEPTVKKLSVPVEPEPVVVPEPVVEPEQVLEPELESDPLVVEAITIPYKPILLGALVLLVLLFFIGKKKSKSSKGKEGPTPKPEGQLGLSKDLHSELNQLSEEIKSKKSAEENFDFWSVVPLFIVYPLTKNALLDFVFVVVTFYIINMVMFIPLLTVPFIILFFYCAIDFSFKIIQSSASKNSKGVFDWSSFGHLTGGVRKALCFICALAIWFGPSIYYFINHAQGPDTIFYVLTSIGLVLMPMSFLAIAVGAKGIAFLNPILLVRSIVRTFVPYLFAAIFLMCCAGLNIYLSLTDLAYIPLWGKPVKWIAFGYTLIITMHLLGSLYRAYRSKLNWFPEQQKKTGQVVYENEYGKI